MIATAVDISQAIDSLPQHEFVRLRDFAENRVVRIGCAAANGRTADDLLHEAVTRLLEGTRHWDSARINISLCLIGVMRSIASAWAGHLANNVRIAAYELPAGYIPKKRSMGGHKNADSQLVHILRDATWIPQGDAFVRPADATRDLLPEGFAFDPGWRWLKVIKFGQDVAQKSEEQRKKQAIAKEFGFIDNESLERAQRFTSLPQVEQERILADFQNRARASLPQQEPKNPERRAAEVGKAAATAPERISEQRSRAVSIGREEVKQEAEQYLRDQYTNDGEMICQVCKLPLPFKLDDGTYYCEKVEFLTELKRRHYQNYLSLCPNHGAMFREANGSRESLPDLFSALDGPELKVVLARTETTIYFTKTHIADLRTIIQVDGEEPVSGGMEGQIPTPPIAAQQLT